MKKKIVPIIVCFLLIFLAAASVEAKSIIKIGGDVTVEKNQQADNVIVVSGQATINGLVEQNVVVISGSVVLTNNAVVRGNVVCIGGVVARGNSAQVFGDITEINSLNISTAIASVFRGELEGWSLILNIISLCFFALILIIALLMTILIPRPLLAVIHKIQSYKVKSFFWGFLATLTMGPFFMLLVISLIGITLIPLAFTALLLAFIVGYIATGTLIGNYFLMKIFRMQKMSLIGGTFLGLILLWLIGWIPYIGWMVKIFVLTFGLGGVLLALFYSRKHPTAATTPPPVIEEPAKTVVD